MIRSSSPAGAIEKLGPGKFVQRRMGPDTVKCDADACPLLQPKTMDRMTDRKKSIVPSLPLRGTERGWATYIIHKRAVVSGTTTPKFACKDTSMTTKLVWIRKYSRY